MVVHQHLLTILFSVSCSQQAQINSQVTQQYYSPDVVEGTGQQAQDDFLAQQQEEYFKRMGEFEPVKMSERARDLDMPVGLKNVGNSK